MEFPIAGITNESRDLKYPYIFKPNDEGLKHC